METITVSPGEQRVVLLFDAKTPGGEREKLVEYLKAHDLTPRREYTEEIDGVERDHSLSIVRRHYASRSLMAASVWASSRSNPVAS